MKKTNLLILLIIMFLVGCSNSNTKNKSNDKTQLIGQVWSMSDLNRLDILKDSLSYHISPPFDSLNKKFAIDYFELKNGGFLVVLCEVVDRAHFQQDSVLIIDTLMVPKLNNDEFIGIGQCRINMKFENSIIGIVKDDSQPYETVGIKDKFNNNVIKTWRVDLINGKIVDMENSNIDYYAEP